MGALAIGIPVAYLLPSTCYYFSPIVFHTQCGVCFTNGSADVGARVDIIVRELHEALRINPWTSTWHADASPDAVGSPSMDSAVSYQKGLGMMEAREIRLSPPTQSAHSENSS